MRSLYVIRALQVRVGKSRPNPAPDQSRLAGFGTASLPAAILKFRPVHEISLATSILETSQRYVGEGVLESVRLAVGELSSIEPELLVFAWEAVVNGTRHQDSRLIVDWVLARQICPRCGSAQPRTAGQWFPACPGCGSPLAIDGGYEMDIMEVTFREPESGTAPTAGPLPSSEESP